MSYIDPASKLMAHADRIAMIRDGKIPPPVNVEIDLSNRCNLGCDACHFGYVHSRGPLAKRRAHDTGDLMDGELLDRLPGELQAAGVRSVTWTGGGEPTLHPQSLQALMDMKLDQGIYTNGTRVTPGIAGVLKHRMQWVYVSLDRADRESYREYKKVDAFEAALQGIKNLVNAEGPATIGVGFLLSESNWDHIPAMALLARSLGADYCQFRPQIDYDLNQPNITRPQYWIADAVEVLKDVTRDPFVIADIARFRALQNWRGHGYQTCYWTQLQAMITPDGRVWRCVNRRGFEEDCIGDLNTEPFAAIWERSAPFTVNDQCRVMCRGHIPNLALNQAMQPGPHWRFI